MWGPTALLLGKLQFAADIFIPDDFCATCPWRIKQLTWCQCRGAKGIGGNHPWQWMTCPPHLSPCPVSMAWKTTSRSSSRGRRGQLAKCIIANLMSQPASLTLVKQVLHNVHIAAQAGIDALMNKNIRGVFGYRYEVEAVGVGSIYLLGSKGYEGIFIISTVPQKVWFH